MRRNLISRVNMESDDVGVAANATPEEALASATEAVNDVVEVEQQVEATGGEVVQLESALINICNLEDAAEALVEGGADEKLVAEQLAPVAIEAIAQVDEGLADETQEEAAVAMEADDPKEAAKGVWARVKEKAIQIWEAVKKAVLRFWNWIKELLDRKLQAAKKVKAAAVALTSAAKAKENWKTSEVASRDSWTMGDKVLDAKGINAAVNGVAKAADATVRVSAAQAIAISNLIGKLGSSADREAVVKEAEAKLEEITKKDSVALRQQHADVTANGLSLTVKDGKVASSKAPADAKVTTADKATTVDILTGVGAIADRIVAAHGAESKAVKALDANYAAFEKAVKEVKDDAELAKFSSRVVVFKNIVSATYRAAREDFNPLLLRSAQAGLSFAKASIDAA